ncbi:MAG: hypothetical protein IKP88_09450 [Lachnospiraceae bacterium]|nr:hypothetical protein [Lachnospiraceae bacterium]
MDIRISGLYDNSQIYSVNRAAASKTADTEAKSTVKGTEETPAAVYEKTDSSGKAAVYTINKMSSSERASLVSRMKADQEMRQNQLSSLVSKMMGGQATAFTNATDMWRFLAKGDFTVSADVKLQAQKDIAEDGYWGVQQTSQRLFDFASALAGDDEDKMRKMEAAMEKGFKQAMGDWGRELPQISQDTMEAARKLFSDYYAANSKETGVAVNI